ncbi:hypothetical protein CHS0354_008037 [Potamilus streckersoni]|uniref:Uncharacterized protein n=1 Tax=Potamilus streckersoni TaxID=2493646 RepID=A0AAE0VVM0_9BIVA|nr:hypothetical protein CHS0354_008037 [Potamilus streckersoni]
MRLGSTLTIQLRDDGWKKIMLPPVPLSHFVNQLSHLEGLAHHKWDTHQGCSLVFKSKTSKSDYHDKMNAEYFTEWFRDTLIPKPDRSSVIIMDNASYHSKLDHQRFQVAVKLRFKPGLIDSEFIMILKCVRLSS